MPVMTLIYWALGAGVVFLAGFFVRAGFDDTASALALLKSQLATHEQRAVENAIAYQVAEDAASIDVGHKAVVVRDRIVTKTVTLMREVPQRVTPEAVKACVVPMGFVELHNSSATAAAGTAPALPDTTRGAANANSGVGLDTVSNTILVNYQRCNQALDRANAEWPAWYTKAKAAYDAWARKQK